MKKTIITGITGASGSIYALNFLRHASAHGIDLRIIVSSNGEAVFKHETGMSVSEAIMGLDVFPKETGSIRLYDNNDMFADIASGTHKTDGMVIVPCSMKTLSGIANGYSSSLLERAADVMLKERRDLILTLRETPLSLVHLRNMVHAAEAGAIILPAAPGLYHKPETIDDLADFITGKIFDQLGIEHSLNTVWR